MNAYLVGRRGSLQAVPNIVFLFFVFPFRGIFGRISNNSQCVSENLDFLI
jgi:hypothetical protein